MSPTVDGFLEGSTGRFAYLAAGPGDGRVVVCLHGFPDHAESFAPLLARLGAAGYRAVAPWMRGYSPSVASGPYHGEALAGDALAIGRALAGGGRFALLGHDWGAVATWLAATRRPPDLACAVTMAVPHPLALAEYLARNPAHLRHSWYMLFFQLPRLPEQALARGDFALVDWLWRTWSPGFALPAPARERLHACLRASMPAPVAYYRAIGRMAVEAAAGLRRPGGLGRPIELPVLHLHGAQDRCIAPEAAGDQRRFLRGPFDSEVIGRTGHFLQLEDPDLVSRRVLRWLRMYFPPHLRTLRRSAGR
jgi:pimeloyl-ACP methyl ester carboxylesterase